MSNRNATFAKRQREQNQKDKASQKAARREERRTEKVPRAPGEAGGDDDIDPDLVGIVPGPQPRDEDEAPPEDLSVSLVPSRDQDSA
jgi:hypothetical protein